MGCFGRVTLSLTSGYTVRSQRDWKGDTIVEARSTFVQGANSSCHQKGFLSYSHSLTGHFYES